jgi:hypothetical protein
MTSAWRQAVDGRARCIRAAKDPRSLRIHESYYASSPTLRRRVDGDWKQMLRLTTSAGAAFSRNLQSLLPQAELMLVSKEIADRVDEGLRNMHPAVNRVFRSELVPFSPGLVWFEEPMSIYINDEDLPPGIALKQTDFTLVGIFFHHADIRFLGDATPGYAPGDTTRGLGVVAWLSNYGGMLMDTPPDYIAPLTLESCPYGWSAAERFSRLLTLAPDRNDGLLQSWVMEFLWGLFEYMQQRLLVTEPTTTENKAQLRDLRRLDYNPTVQIVRWRKESREYDPDHEPAEVEWSCHWRVKQHTRRYKSGKVVTIKPYLKGDRSKPFKQPNLTVNVVDR